MVENTAVAGTGVTSDFNFDNFQKEAKNGLEVLAARKEKLKETIEEATAELEKVETQLARLDAIVGAMDLTAPTPARKSNVQALVVEVVDALFVGHNDNIPETSIITNVRVKDVEVKEKSIQAVLFRMTKSGKLARHGKRGRYEYKLIVPGDGVDPGLPHGDKPSAEDLIVEVIAQKPAGASEKDIAWATGDLAVAHPILASLIERGAVVVSTESGEAVYKMVPKSAEQRTMFDAEPAASS